MSHRLREGDVAGLEIQLGFSGSSENFSAVIVELAFPSGYDDGRETVADEVYAGAAHVHQLVDAEDDGDTDRAEAGWEKAIQGGEWLAQRRKLLHKILVEAVHVHGLGDIDRIAPRGDDGDVTEVGGRLVRDNT